MRYDCAMAPRQLACCVPRRRVICHAFTQTGTKKNPGLLLEPSAALDGFCNQWNPFVQQSCGKRSPFWELWASLVCWLELVCWLRSDFPFTRCKNQGKPPNQKWKKSATGNHHEPVPLAQPPASSFSSRSKPWPTKTPCTRCISASILGCFTRGIRFSA